MIKTADNRTMRVFLTQRIGGDDPKSRTSTLVFRQHGRAYHLFQVWVSDDMNGNQLSTVDENNTPGAIANCRLPIADFRLVRQRDSSFNRQLAFDNRQCC